MTNIRCKKAANQLLKISLTMLSSL